MIITLDTHGGMIHYISQLANALSKSEDIIIIAPFGVEKKNFTKNVKIIELELGTTIKKFLVNTLILTRPIKFLNTIRKEKPDILHFNDNPMWQSFFLPFLINYPIVTTIHDVRPHIGSRKVDEIIGLKMHIKFSDYLIVHGEKAKKELRINDKCHIIPHGDFSFFLDFKKKNVNEEENTILFFGRIEEYKGLEYLIKSVNSITATIPDIKLIIAGGGDFNMYKNMILDNKNYEVHNRFIPDEDVSYFFQRAKIVVLPYIECTQSGIIHIAYAFKKPVIATDVGSISEVVEDGRTGLIIRSRDINALIGAIIRLLKDNKLRQQMGENAYKKMKEELSWNYIAEKTINIYKEAIKDKMQLKILKIIEN